MSNRYAGWSWAQSHVFTDDVLREAAQQFIEVTRGYTKHQRDIMACLYFTGVAKGAKLARDPDLQARIEDWIRKTLRPQGFDVTAQALGINTDVEPARPSRKRNGEVSRQSGSDPLVAG